jgi:hypothetical protein
VDDGRRSTNSTPVSVLPTAGTLNQSGKVLRRPQKATAAALLVHVIFTRNCLSDSESRSEEFRQGA